MKNKVSASDFTVRQLPSGFWSVWYSGHWLEASFPSKAAAEEYIASTIHNMNK